MFLSKQGPGSEKMTPLPASNDNTEVALESPSHRVFEEECLRQYGNGRVVGKHHGPGSIWQHFTAEAIKKYPK